MVYFPWCRVVVEQVLTLTSGEKSVVVCPCEIKFMVQRAIFFLSISRYASGISLYIHIVSLLAS